MHSFARSTLTMLGLAALIAFSFVVGSGRASAQDATPPMEDMGVCTTALGIGQEGDACVNIIHASPDAPAVDVYINGEMALEKVEFSQFSGWLPLAAGEYQVQVTASGDTPENAVIDTQLTIEAGNAYHVAAVGTLDSISVAVIQSDLSELEADTARVRVIHASPDAPAVDVAVTGGDVLITDLAFGAASDYLEVPAASYDLEVRPTGTMDVALALPGVELEAGMVYDILAVGQLGDESLAVLVIPSSTTGGSMATPTN
jgi:hypothetical protein